MEEKKIVTSKSEILATVAYCGIKQSPYAYPKNLIESLAALSKKIDDEKIFESPVKRDYQSYRIFDTHKELYKLIDRLIKSTPEISIWNVTQIEQDNGITNAEDPNRTVQNVFVSRYSVPLVDRDFIDLDALARNVMEMLG